jgi:hypothetical protein
VTDPLPDWFRKIFAERQEIAMERMAQAQTTEQLWDVKGRISAFLDIKNEIEMYEAQVVAAEKEAAERYLKADA